jgi:hypothetical protein
LFALATAGELCVGELALTWDLMSCGLKMPRLEHCLPQRLTIASPETGGGHR